MKTKIQLNVKPFGVYHILPYKYSCCCTNHYGWLCFSLTVTKPAPVKKKKKKKKK